jgi:putative transposase
LQSSIVGASQALAPPTAGMARPLRPLVHDGVYHAFTRGNEKIDIYRDDRDREVFLELVDRVVRRMDWRCLSYCLMGTHFHLLVQTRQPNLDRGMQQLKGGYAQRFNRRHERVGHLFQGRYGAVLIQQDSHLLEVFRYVARNPVKEGWCADPADWRWGAHAALAGYVSAPPFLDVDEARAWFGPRNGAARYAEFVAQTAQVPYEPAGVVFGDASFKRSVLPDADPGVEFADRDWSAGRPPLTELLEPADDGRGIARAYLQHGYSLSEIGAVLGCHPCTVSRRLQRYEEETLESKI